MPSIRQSLKVGGIVLMIAAFCTSARAALVACNDTAETLNIAVAWSQEGDWKSRGWARVPARTCEKILGGDLQSRYYWYYAELAGSDGKESWNGKGSEHAGYFCTQDAQFFFRDANQTNCEGFSFRRIDTGDYKAYSFNITESQDPTGAAENCAAELPNGLDSFSDCWISSMATAKQQKALECAAKSKSGTSLAMCAASLNPVTEDAVKVADCTSRYFREKDPSALADCASVTGMSAENAKAIQCAAQATDEVSIAACLATPQLTNEQRRLAECVTRNRTSYGAMATCALSKNLNSTQRRVLECAATHKTNYLDAGLCSVSSNLTPEQQVFIRCAIQTGGQPYAMAVCVGGQLTANELQKCVERGIGGNGCFGKNNTLVKGIQNQWRDVTKGPGPSNEVMKLIGPEAVKFCGRAVGSADAFKKCAGGVLSQNELQKCLLGKDCFGKGNEITKIVDGIRHYGICGGPNSAVRKLFGSGVCGGTKCKKGPRGEVTLINNTSGKVYFTLESVCGRPTALELEAGESDTFTGGKGDQWFNIAVKSNGGLVEYGLDSGSIHEFKWDGELLDVYDATPVFESSDDYKELMYVAYMDRRR